MLDDFENILKKNFCLFANYEDFSFAQSRSTENLQNEFTNFFDYHFQGDFRVKNWFHKNILPRIFFPQQGSKFVHCFKILNNISQCILLQNLFPVADRTRCIVSPDGICYQIGGYLPAINLFTRNTFVLDEHRSQYVALQNMEIGRADHTLLMVNANEIYVFGGMAHCKAAGEKGVESLNSCEVYSISEDKWKTLESFSHRRQQCSVCHFNEHYIFMFGGKCLKPRAMIGGKEPYDFVDIVEVYEIDKKTWKTINYISDPSRLQVVLAGSAQIAGSQILIFGGLVPSDSIIESQPEEEVPEDKKKSQESFDFEDNGREITLTKQTLILDVTVGSIKFGPELPTPSYFVGGGYKLTHNNTIYAFGHGCTPQYVQAGFMSALSAESKTEAKDGAAKKALPEFVAGTSQHKKYLHSYKVQMAKWADVNESIFSGQRRESDLNDDARDD